jgi:hypothetical protein
LASHFVEAFGAEKGWMEPKVAHFEWFEDAEEESAVRKLKANGHKLQWVRVTRLRAQRALLCRFLSAAYRVHVWEGRTDLGSPPMSVLRPRMYKRNRIVNFSS